MISTVLYVIGVIFIILAAAAFLGVTLVPAPAGALLVIGIIAVVAAYLLSGRTGRTRV